MWCDMAEEKFGVVLSDMIDGGKKQERYRERISQLRRTRLVLFFERFEGVFSRFFFCSL